MSHQKFLKAVIVFAIFGPIISACGSGRPEATPADSLQGPSTAPAGTLASLTDTPVPAAATAGPTWQTFSSDEGAFSVLMPETPDEQIQTAPSQAGPFELHVFTATDETSNSVYMVTYNDYPQVVLQDTDIETVLDNGRDGGLANMQAQLVSEQSISLDGYPGRHIVFAIPDTRIPGGGAGVSRLYLVRHRFYQLLALGPKGQAAPADAEQFLNSFRLLEPSP